MSLQKLVAALWAQVLRFLSKQEAAGEAQAPGEKGGDTSDRDAAAEEAHAERPVAAPAAKAAKQTQHIWVWTGRRSWGAGSGR